MIYFKAKVRYNYGKITLYHDQSAAATCVPNIFIDQYMTRANGEYVKIYLYLLRCFAQPSADFFLSGLADHFDCTERIFSGL